MAQDQIYYLGFIGARLFEIEPSALSRSEASIVVCKDLVVDCNAGAWREGIRLGDRLSQAKIISPFCRVFRVEYVSAEFLEKLFDVLLSFTPYVEPDVDKHGFFVQVDETGFDGILKTAGRCFFRVLAGCSSSKTAAKVGSQELYRQYSRGKLRPGKKHYGKVDIIGDCAVLRIDMGMEKEFLAKIPLENFFAVPDDLLPILKAAGFKKVGDIQEIPVAMLSRQIGEIAFFLKAAASGSRPERVTPAKVPVTFEKEVSLDEVDVIHRILAGIDEWFKRYLVGFRGMKVEVTGCGVVKEKRFSVPVFSGDALKSALEMVLQEVSRENLQHAVSLKVTLFDAVKMFVKAKPLVYSRDFSKEVVFPVSLDMVLESVKEKYGMNILRKGENLIGLDVSSNARREKMLAYWDPLRKGIVRAYRG